ncbi:bifunctional GNAT family N-acetyltransferase/(deoxy)nucleoside triphosphate pyrophosphohydrolase [Entomobacter blattae]|uniref:8-oxo-dGTP diphosphatase n=1 Tax=Entomobacter blattae TaxID=2762277 RepID=A0A7H1NUU6_9PROT|nr:GNAT family N-acetyltransferase [Entomobacter blattae]QNT79556.1 Acetyltransferase (GNAT) domain protein [Entomobacter blattae]
MNQPPSFPLFLQPTLKTNRFQLMPFREEDSKNLHHLINDWSVVRTLSDLPFPYPQTMVEDWIKMATTHPQKGLGYYFAIMNKAPSSLLENKPLNRLMGCVAITLEKNKTQAKIGYWVGKKFWNQGIASECVTRVIEWAFAQLPIKTLKALVIEDNIASIRILQKNGFQQTGKTTEKFMAYGKDYPVIVFEATRESFFISRQTPFTPPSPNSLDKIHMSSFASHPKPLLTVSAGILVDIHNKILLAKRPEGKPMAGLWEFPGGKMEKNETPEMTLIREFKEELDIDLSTTCLAPFTFVSQAYAGFHLVMSLFLCRHWKGTPTPKEGQTIQWCLASELKNYPMPEADKPLIPLLCDLL